MKPTAPRRARSRLCSRGARWLGLAAVVASLGCRSEQADPTEEPAAVPSSTQAEQPAREGQLRSEKVTLTRVPLVAGTVMTRSASRRTDLVWRDAEAPDSPAITEVSALSEADTTEVLETTGQAIVAARITWDRRGWVKIRGGEETRHGSPLQGRTLEVRRDADGTLVAQDAHGRAPDEVVLEDARLACARLGRAEDPLAAVLLQTPLEPGQRISVPPAAVADYVGDEPLMRGEDFRFVYRGLRRDDGVEVAVFDVDQTWILEDVDQHRWERTRLRGEWRVHRVTGWTVSVELSGPVEARRGPADTTLATPETAGRSQERAVKKLTGAGTTKLSWTMTVGP